MNLNILFLLVLLIFFIFFESNFILFLINFSYTWEKEATFELLYLRLNATICILRLWKMEELKNQVEQLEKTCLENSKMIKQLLPPDSTEVFFFIGNIFKQ